MKNKPLLLFLIFLGLIVAVLIAYTIFFVDLNPKTCIKQGELVNNPSLGPAGHLGKCCFGLLPYSSKTQSVVDGWTPLGTGASCEPGL